MLLGWVRPGWRLAVILALGIGAAAAVTHFAGWEARGAQPSRQASSPRPIQAQALVAGVSAPDLFSRHAEAAIAAGDWAEAVTALRQVVQARSRDAASHRDLVWALERAGKDAAAAAYLSAHPWLYRSEGATPGIRAQPFSSSRKGRERERGVSKTGDPGAGSARAGDAAAYTARAEELVARARVQTAAMTSRCIVCHQREPAMDGPAVTRLLFPDRQTLLQALAAQESTARLHPGHRAAADALAIGEIYFYLATLYPPRHREAGEYMARARRSLEQAVAAAPRSAPAWSSLALVRLKQGEAEGAAAAWQRALTLDPNQEEPRINLAGLLQSQGRATEALSLYQGGMRRLPRSAALRTNYGVLLWQLGRYPEAIAAQREALRLKPGEPVALLNLGLALKAAGDLPGAEAALRESIRRRPGGAVAHNALGSLLAQRGDWQAAARAFAEAARHNPGLAAAHANLGRAYEHLGRWADAAEAYQRAILWEPERTELRERVTMTRARAARLKG